MKRVCILGGGFSSLLTAHLLSRKGYEVTIVEKNLNLGGVLGGIRWNELNLDLGCHLFDNTDATATSTIFDMAGGEQNFSPLNVRYATFTKGHLTHDLAVPSFNHLGEEVCGKFLIDMLRSCSSGEKTCRDLTESINARFGVSLAQELLPIVEKIFVCDPMEIDACASEQGVFQRINFLSANMANLLKSIPMLDERIAIAYNSLPENKVTTPELKPFRNFYPKKGGMKDFINNSVERLKSLNVQIRLGAGVSKVVKLGSEYGINLENGDNFKTDKIISSLPLDQNEELFLGSNQLSKLVHQVPMLLVYFLASEEAFSDLTYVHNYDSSYKVFRASNAGKYGKQINESGMTYAIAEVPCAIDSVLWNLGEKIALDIWNEMHVLGLLKSGAIYSDSLCLRVPKTYLIPKAGFQNCANEIEETIARNFDGLEIIGSLSASKATIMQNIMKQLESW